MPVDTIIRLVFWTVAPYTIVVFAYNKKRLVCVFSVRINLCRLNRYSTSYFIVRVGYIQFFPYFIFPYI